MTNNREIANEILDEELDMDDDADTNTEKAEQILDNLGLLEEDEN